jgi:hypothetical protein
MHAQHHVLSKFLKLQQSRLRYKHISLDGWPETRLKLELSHVPWLAVVICGKGYRVFSPASQFDPVPPDCVDALLRGANLERVEASEGWARGLREVILHAARSETSSNSWKLSVINDASLSAWVVGTRSRTSWMAARKSANVA